MTRPSAITDDQRKPHRLPSRRWVGGNLLFALLLCAVAGAGEPADLVVATCVIVPFRAAAALLEWYLVPRRHRRGVAISHLVGVGLGLMIGTSPPTPAGPTVSGWTVGVSGYVFISLMALGVVAAVAFVRAMRRGGPLPEDADAGWSVSSLPAVFWFNAVFILAAALLVAPSMAAESDGGSLTYGFAGGVLVGVLLRLPGAMAEWWLTKRHRQRLVYGLHLGAGLLTALIVATPTPEGAAAPSDPVASAVGIFLLLSSLFLLAAMPVVALIDRAGRRSRPGTEAMEPKAPEGVYRGVAPAPAPPSPVPAREEPADGAGRTVSNVERIGRGEWRDQAERGHQAGRDDWARRDDRGRRDDHRSSPEGRGDPAGREDRGGRAEKVRNEIAVALGIVVGLASLVQGYDSTDPYRTVVVALAIGLIGLGVIYGVSIRR